MGISREEANELLSLARQTEGRLSTIEQWIKDRPCDSHSKEIKSMMAWRNYLLGIWAATTGIAAFISQHKKIP